MRFYTQSRSARILMLSANLALCGFQAELALRHHSMEHTVTALCWGIITILNVLTFWGTYWKLTPEGLLERRGLFVRRIIPYRIIQDVSPDDPAQKKWGAGRIRISVFMEKPVLAHPDEYERFVSELEQHLDPALLHV